MSGSCVEPDCGDEDRTVRAVGERLGYGVSEVLEKGSCEEEAKWPVAAGEKSDDTAAHTARILSSRGSSLPEKETTHTI